MNILVSNDDGVDAIGLKTLVEHLKKIAQVTVVAPDRNRSGSSSSLTLDKPLMVNEVEKNIYAVDGTPTDCVHIALTGLIKIKPDMVISGINDGPNMGDDTIYSGTVAAAMEGYLYDIPSFAISMGQKEPNQFDTAARVTLDLIEKFKHHPFTSPTLLNINVPDLPFEQLRGFQVTRLGKRHQAEPVIDSTSPNGEKLYWVGAAGEPNDGGPGTDFFAIKENYVSISPIQADLTQHKEIGSLSEWIEK
jgi:5'-nucleotidase